METNDRKVGDIYLNTFAEDIWILNKIWNEELEDEVWTLNLVNDDLHEELDCVEGFVKIGNIYDLIKNYIVDDD